MFYRRKIILALLQAFEGKLDKISLQKLLFLLCNRQSKPDYDFVPYLFGCFSFSANADLAAMVKHGILNETKESFYKNDNVNYHSKLKEIDKKVIIDIKDTYGKLSSNSLMKLTYINYQYHAINSIVAENILTPEQYLKVRKAKPSNDKTILYTIGYEGISLEEYLNRLIKNDVKVLVDVRSNPLSMKYGFSKKQLMDFCSKLHIEYIHIPEVGIISEQRQELNSQSDYDSLFNSYIDFNLKETKTQQEQIMELLLKNKRIALTCFEANICQCHRKHLAEAIAQNPKWQFELKHI